MKSYQKLAIGILTITLPCVSCLAFYIYEGYSPICDTLGIIAIIALFLYLLILYFNYIKVQRKRLAEEQHKPSNGYVDIEELPASDTILYLRPFKIDDQKITEIEYGGIHYKSIEPIICRMFSDAGTPVAIGNPSKNQSPDQSLHIAPSDNWKANVTQLLERSSFVTLYVDFTEGVKWELAQALSGYKHKLILIPTLYNTHEKGSYAAALFSFVGISYLLHSLRYHHFSVFKKWRRKRAYYKKWAAAFPGFGFSMDDTVSAVIFEDGKAIPFYAEKPNLESQFNAINRAINTKLGVRMPPNISIKPNEQPLFSLSAEMDMPMLPGNIAYFSQGQVDFYEAGFRYHAPLLQLMSKGNINIRHHYRKHLRYQKDQLWPYTAIEATQYLDKNTLRIVCEKANGSSKLVFPACHADCMNPLKIFLEQKRGGYSNPALVNELSRIQRVQENDYAMATLLVEGFGLAAGLLLWLLSLNSGEFHFLLTVYGAFWNLICVFFYWCFYRRLKNALLPLIQRWLSASLQIKVAETRASASKLLSLAAIFMHALLGFLLLTILV